MPLDKIQQHVASQEHCFEASEFLGHTKVMTVVGVIVGCAMIMLGILWYQEIGAWMPEELDRQNGKRGTITPGTLTTLGALVVFAAVFIRQARWFRILFDGGLPTDVWEKHTKKLTRHWSEVGILVDETNTEGIRFIGRSKKNNAFYYWAAVPALTKIDGQDTEGYAVAHFDAVTKQKDEPWVALNLFVPGPLRDCIAVLKDLSNDLNRELEAHREANGQKISFKVRFTPRLAEYVLRDWAINEPRP